MSLRNETLKNYFLTNFALMQHHHYSLYELENMMPWERATYVALVSKYVREENERIKLEAQQRAANAKKRMSR